MKKIAFLSILLVFLLSACGTGGDTKSKIAWAEETYKIGTRVQLEANTPVYLIIKSVNVYPAVAFGKVDVTINGPCEAEKPSKDARFLGVQQNIINWGLPDGGGSTTVVYFYQKDGPTGFNVGSYNGCNGVTVIEPQK